MEVTDSMKNANGFGSITKYTDKKRRKPYVARVTLSLDVDDAGKLIQERKVIGSFATQKEAMAALVEFHNNPLVFEQDSTFEEVFLKWSEKRFETLSDSAIRRYRAAYKRSSPLHRMKMRDIQAYALQKIIDEQDVGLDTKKTMMQMYHGMFKFAIANQLVPNGINPAEYITLPAEEEPKNKHIPFTKKEVAALFEHADDPNVQLVLMLIYTGVRPGELVPLKKEDVHLDERWFHIVTGKNKNATRDVPIHWAVLPFFESRMKEPGDFLVTRFDGGPYVFERDRNMFRDVFEAAVALTGSETAHKPHDCRHTFTSLWKGQKLDEAMRRKIQGHAGDGIGERVYMLPDIEDLKAEMDLLWTPKVLPTGCLPCEIPRNSAV